jgi:hypothetical protein
MSIYYEVESDTIRIMSRREPIRITVALWEITESTEAADKGATSTTTRRIVQSWLLPVDIDQENV